jgi:hypothetical protein
MAAAHPSGVEFKRGGEQWLDIMMPYAASVVVRE